MKSCPECGLSITKKDMNGLTMPYKDKGNYTFTGHLAVSFCRECQEHYLNGADINELQNQIEAGCLEQIQGPKQIR